MTGMGLAVGKNDNITNLLLFCRNYDIFPITGIVVAIGSVVAIERSRSGPDIHRKFGNHIEFEVSWSGNDNISLGSMLIIIYNC